MEPKLERKSNIKLNWLSCGGYSLLMRSAYLQCPSQKAVHKGQMYKLKECTLFYFSFFNFEIFRIVCCKLISLGQTLNVLSCLKKSIWTVGFVTVSLCTSTQNSDKFFWPHQHNNRSSTLLARFGFPQLCPLLQKEMKAEELTFWHSEGIQRTKRDLKGAISENSSHAGSGDDKFKESRMLDVYWQNSWTFSFHLVQLPRGLSSKMFVYLKQK